MERTYLCDHCGETVAEHQLVLVGEDILCLSCADELTVCCDECGARIYLEDDEGDDTHRPDFSGCRCVG